MVKYPVCVWEQFYEPLVGSREAVESLQTRLSRAVLANKDDFFATDPYGRLADEFNNAIDESVTQIDERERIRKGIKVNGTFGGELTLAAIATVGDIYTSRAQVPQAFETVQHSTRRAIGYMFGLAFTGKLVGSHNVEAARLGINPRNPLSISLTAFSGGLAILSRSSVAKRTFKVEDRDGQLLIKPKFQHDPAILNRQCPATHTKVEVDGSRRSGLNTLLNTLGDVAVADIFPYYFHMSDETS